MTPIDLDYQPAPALGLHVFGSFESGDYATACIAGEGDIEPNYNAGSQVFPFSNKWSTDSERRTWGAGAGLRLDFWKRFDWRVDYSLFFSREELAYCFERPGRSDGGRGGIALS